MMTDEEINEKVDELCDLLIDHFLAQQKPFEKKNNLEMPQNLPLLTRQAVGTTIE